MLEPRPIDSNILTQDIPTNKTNRNTVGRNMLATLLQRAATCCELKIELVRMLGRNIVQHEPSQTTTANVT